MLRLCLQAVANCQTLQQLLLSCIKQQLPKYKARLLRQGQQEFEVVPHSFARTTGLDRDAAMMSSGSSMSSWEHGDGEDNVAMDAGEDADKDQVEGMDVDSSADVCAPGAVQPAISAVLNLLLSRHCTSSSSGQDDIGWCWSRHCHYAACAVCKRQPAADTASSSTAGR